MDLRRGARATAAWFLGLALVVSLTQAHADTAGRLGEISKDIESVSSEIEGLEAQYINPDLLERRYEVETRLNEGQRFFIEEDYRRASVVFLDLVDNPKIKGKPAHRDALYYLAECLYRDKNYIGARRHFSELLSIGAEDYYQDAISRQIEIAIKLQSHGEIENLYKAAKARLGDKLEPQLVYVYAKSRYFRGDDDGALATFREVPASSDYNLQSLYFQGVILAKEASKLREQLKRADKETQARLEEESAELLSRAEARFEEVLGLADPAQAEPKDAEVAELCWLALGRIAYERGDFEAASLAYGKIPQQSPHAERAIYETIWSQIKGGQLQEAQQNLDVFLVNAPNSALAPEARLLRGDLLLELEAFDEAVDTYNGVVREYEPVRDELKSMMAQRGGPKAYFDALVGREVDAPQAVEVPEIVAAWLKSDPEMELNLAIAADLDTSRVDVEESQEIIEELEDAIDSRSKIDIFPGIKEGWGQGLEVQSKLLGFRRDLLEIERKIVLERAPQSDEYRLALAERQRVERGYDQIPKEKEALEAREKKVKSRYTQIEDEIYRLTYDIDTIRAQLVAMDKWMKDLKKEGTQIAPSDEATIRQSMDEQYKTLEELEAKRIELRKIARRARTQTGINDDVAEREEEIKREFAAAIAQERKVLAGMRGSVGGEELETLRRLDALHEAAGRQDARLDGYFGKMAQLVDQKVEELRLQLDAERSRVGEYDGELNVYSGDSEGLSNEIAAKNFARVEEKFGELVLKADVGTIDVSWKRKEQRTVKIRALFEKKGQELKALEQGVGEGEEAER